MAHSVPKYMFLVNWVKDQIAQGELKYGDKLYSENELCGIFGISRQTVRQAIGILEQEKYLERHRGSGTFIVFNQSDHRVPTKKIGVISTYVGEYIFTNILRSIESVLANNGYTMQLTFTHNKIENERRALQTMLDSDVDGIIVEPTKSGLPNPNISMYHDIMHRGIPLIFFNAAYPEESFPVVSLNDTAAGALAVNYLIRAGHQKIGGLFQSDDIQGRLRYSGFLQALMKANISLNGENIIWYTTEDIEDLPLYPERIIKRLTGCTGVVCYNDQIGAKLVKILRQAGITVPEQISIVSIDNSDIASMCEVPLTSIANPVNLLGETVAQNILTLIQNPHFDAGVQFVPEIVERDSVKKLAASDSQDSSQIFSNN